MPTMYEIYERHAPEYDALVTHEDYQGNLARTLHELYDFSGKDVAEFGVGTGRVTVLIADKARSVTCFDRSAHMTAFAQAKLNAYANKISFVTLNNLAIDSVTRQFDCVIEGWSFGHTVLDQAHDLDGIVDKLVHDCRALLRPGGAIIFMETMGTFVSEPAPPIEGLARFYARLTQHHGFAEHIIRTDYRFADVAQAAEIMGFFFGDEMGERVRQARQSIIEEYTGIWVG